MKDAYQIVKPVQMLQPTRWQDTAKPTIIEKEEREHCHPIRVLMLQSGVYRASDWKFGNHVGRFDAKNSLILRIFI